MFSAHWAKFFWVFGISLLLCPQVLYCQKEPVYWYFGDGAGLLFNEDGPVGLTDGALRTLEGCSTISDSLGNLLFYTDGSTVYNRQHQIMPNGRGLKGNYSSTQSALIIPIPSKDKLFYIFTVDWMGGTEGLRYSLLDMDLDNGLGDVTTEKNILLHTPTTEKLTAIHHLNGKDFWLISHRWESDEFLVYRISKDGLDPNPISSKIGSIHGSQSSKRNYLGQMKVSPNKKRLALCIFNEKKIEIFDFNAKNGRISRPISLQLPPRGDFFIYGLEFSPNSKRLYVAEAILFDTPINSDRILQYDLTVPDNKLADSELIIGSLTNAGALQLGPDQRIYAAEINATALSVINNPNFRGLKSQFIPNSVELPTGESLGGLPGFIQSYLAPETILIMPNIFTPNGDIYNNTFKPEKILNVNEIHLTILNRWGREIHETTDLEEFVQGWSGEGFASAVYYWTLSFEGSNGKEGFQRGWVQLLR